MLRYILVIITGILTSIYYFPVFTTLLPSALNTKMLMAVIGLCIGGWKMLSSGRTNVDRTFLLLSVYAIIVSLVCRFSITYNNTVDTAYASYVVPMWVWLSGAYAVCNIIKAVHGHLSISLLTNYLAAVCVCQCVLAVVINNVPSVQDIVDTYVLNDRDYLHKVDRLYGIGASLDTAGMRFSLVLVLLAHLMLNIHSTIYKKYLWLYVIAYLIIVVIGNMMARTTTVGVVISLFYIILESEAYKFRIKSNVRILWMWIAAVVVITFAISVLR